MSCSGPRTGPGSTSARRSPRARLPYSARQGLCRPAAGALCFAGAMTLPLAPPLLPQLARSAKELPTGDGWSYEPKWDGFRAIAFVDGDDVYLQSRNGRPLTRYFPELKFPGRPLRARRRDRAVRRARPAGLRRARPAHPPGRVAHPHAGRADPDALHRLRPARRRRRGSARAAAARAPRAAREARRRARSTSRRPSSTPTAPRSGWRAPRASSPRSSTRPTAPASARGC